MIVFKFSLAQKYSNNRGKPVASIRKFPFRSTHDCIHKIPGEYLGALRGNCHCDVQIDQNKLHKIFHLRSHSERSCPENYCKHLMQSESVATPWGRWAKTMPLICFPTGRRFCFELCPEFVISYPDYGLKIPRRLSFLFRNLPGKSPGLGEAKKLF